MNLVHLLACAICFGDPSSALTKGAFWGVVTLMGIAAILLGCIAATAFVWFRKARKLSHLS